MSDACPVCGGKPREEVKYVSMCAKHQKEQNEEDARRMGVPDLRLSIEDPTFFVQLREALGKSINGFILVKVQK